MQLLGADEEQSIVQNRSIQGIIQEYGHSLTSNDPRLALEYYWQSAAVVGASPTIKVGSSARRQVIHVCVHMAVAAAVPCHAHCAILVADLS